MHKSDLSLETHLASLYKVNHVHNGEEKKGLQRYNQFKASLDFEYLLTM